MKNKISSKECKCIHCQQKLDQINNSRLFWDRVIIPLSRIIDKLIRYKFGKNIYLTIYR